MRVVDTSAWIEWLRDSPTGAAVRPHVPDKSHMVVPTIVQLELAKWLLREAPEEFEAVIGVTRECVVSPLTTEVALLAAEMTAEHRLATADAIVYATALTRSADLLTCDAHFAELDGVLYIPKASQ